jgi:hypothetical protein
MTRHSLASRRIAPVIGAAALAMLTSAGAALADTAPPADAPLIAPPPPMTPPAPTVVAPTTVVEPAPAPVISTPTMVAEPAMGQPVVAERTTAAPPNTRIVAGGLFTLAGAYIPSVIVAAANNDSWNNHLYIPVVGPWLDLGNRPPCGGLFQTSCGAEDGFKALLIVDGVFQGLGALGTVLGLVTPQPRTQIVTAKTDADARKKAAKANLHVVPASLGQAAYGLAAFGNF